MESTLVWPIWIALDLFFAGVSGGAFATAVVAGYLGERYAKVRRWGALISPFPVIMGLVLLVIDLGSPAKFYTLLFRINPRSVMSMGTWLITLFSIGACLFAWHILYEEKKVKFTLLPPALLKFTAIFGVPAGVALGTYTAFLLNASVAITLWNNAVLPLIFLSSALATGVATVMVAVALSNKWDVVAYEVGNLTIATTVLLGLQAFAMAAYIWGLHIGDKADQAALAVLNTEYALSFWGGVWVLGVALPLLIKFLGGQGLSRNKPLLMGALVFVGGMILRIVIVLAGQSASPLY